MSIYKEDNIPLDITFKVSELDPGYQGTGASFSAPYPDCSLSYIGTRPLLTGQEAM